MKKRFNEEQKIRKQDGCLDRWIFTSVREAKAVIAQWLDEYTTVRPHGSLRGKTPAIYTEQDRISKGAAARKCLILKLASFSWAGPDPHIYFHCHAVYL